MNARENSHQKSSPTNTEKKIKKKDRHLQAAAFFATIAAFPSIDLNKSSHATNRHLGNPSQEEL